MVATCTTELDIVNAALRYLGGRGNISTTDTTNSAVEMRAAFRLVRDTLIRSYNWNCCIKEDTAALLEEIKGADRPYVYAIPSDCLQIISMNGQFTGYSGAETVERYNPLYKIRGQKIYTRIKYPLIIEYSFRNEDVTSYDASFCTVLALDLALATCERITQSDSKFQRLTQLRRTAIDEALRANALEIPARPKPTGNWLRSRRFIEWGQE
nr:MAG TPA: tail tubular protein [Bacteriophage sp.]